MKYYIKQGNTEGLATQAGDYSIKFENAAFIAGSWWGIFATDDPKVGDALDKIVGSKGVMSVSKEEFESIAKKKNRPMNTVQFSEPVEDKRPTPQDPKAQSAPSAPEEPSPIEDTPQESRSMDELLQTKERDTSAPINFVTSQSALADELGISINKMRDLMAIDDNPGKEQQGYNVARWKEYVEAPVESE